MTWRYSKLVKIYQHLTGHTCIVYTRVTPSVWAQVRCVLLCVANVSFVSDKEVMPSSSLVG